jgi:hypothetical protein
MVSNLVGVAQQFIINRLTKAPPATSPSEPEKTGKKPAKKKKTKEALAN